MLSAKVRTYNLARLQNNHFVTVNFHWLLVFFSFEARSVSQCQFLLEFENREEI